jgi:hypothetical protein
MPRLTEGSSDCRFAVLSDVQALRSTMVSIQTINKNLQMFIGILFTIINCIKDHI